MKLFSLFLALFVGCDSKPLGKCLKEECTQGLTIYSTDPLILLPSTQCECVQREDAGK